MLVTKLKIVSTTRCLELLHMDLFGPSTVWSYRGNRYTLVIVDDYSREFDNEVQFGEFCIANGITHNFSAPRTPQSNGVVERKNRTLQEMRKTPYELLRGRKPTLDYYRVFGSYSQNIKAYIILNKHTRKIEESLNVTFDETTPPSKTSPLVDDDLDEDEDEAIKVTEKKNLENDIEDETLEIDEITRLVSFLKIVVQGYNQQEGIDYDETYASVARLESIRILLAYACAQLDDGIAIEEIQPRVTTLEGQDKVNNYPCGQVDGLREDVDILLGLKDRVQTLESTQQELKMENQKLKGLLSAKESDYNMLALYVLGMGECLAAMEL
ncbi:retrovirus-related pol polyprotein from transposon TNT 1-94 [Tanacetum coccineum]